jgi:hypothetical protein
MELVPLISPGELLIENHYKYSPAPRDNLTNNFIHFMGVKQMWLVDGLWLIPAGWWMGNQNFFTCFWQASYACLALASGETK